MNTTIRNILAVVAGLFIGSTVNMALIMVSSSVIPPPEGADVTTLEGLKASMHLFGPKNFLFPFLAHALGTFTGALLTGALTVGPKMKMAIVVGFIFLIGGISNVIMLPSPIWFSALDLGMAYLPMSYLAGKMVSSRMKAE